jgi:hypothetical protein
MAEPGSPTPPTPWSTPSTPAPPPPPAGSGYTYGGDYGGVTPGWQPGGSQAQYPSQYPAQPTYGEPPVAYGVQQAAYPQPGVSPYPVSPYGYAAPPATEGFAVASLVCSLTGIFTCGITSILAVVFGFLARGRIKKSNGALTGDGMAIAGLVIGFLGVALIVLYIVGMVFAANSPRY